MIDFEANKYLWLGLSFLIIYIVFLFIIGRKKEAWGWAEALGSAFALAVLIMSFVAQSYYVPSGSMIPTIEKQDRLIGNKFIYHFHQPRRQDVIVFEPPFLTDHQRYVKRIIGLPGDTVELRHGYVYIKPPASDAFVRLDESSYDIRRSYSDYGPIVVPDNHYFVLGDNRLNSSDSRAWAMLLESKQYLPKPNYTDRSKWGFVPRENIEAQSMFIFWPLTRIGIVAQ